MGFFFTTSTRFIEHKKVGFVHVAICLRLNAKITGLMLIWFMNHAITVYLTSMLLSIEKQS